MVCKVPADTRRQIMALRQNEPWYPAAAAGFKAIVAGRARRADRIAVTPMAYSRWDAAAQAHQAAEAAQRNNQAARIFNSGGAFDPARLATFSTRAPPNPFSANSSRAAARILLRVRSRLRVPFSGSAFNVVFINVTVW